MHRHSMNRLWILLLASCLLAGVGSVRPDCAQAQSGVSYADDGSGGDRQPDFGPPPSGIGDPDWPSTPGQPAPRVKPGQRGGTSMGTYGAQSTGTPQVRVNDLRTLRFQILLRVWLAYFVR